MPPLAADSRSRAGAFAGVVLEPRPNTAPVLLTTAAKPAQRFREVRGGGEGRGGSQWAHATQQHIMAARGAAGQACPRHGVDCHSTLSADRLHALGGIEEMD